MNDDRRVTGDLSDDFIDRSRRFRRQTANLQAWRDKKT